MRAGHWFCDAGKHAPADLGNAGYQNDLRNTKGLPCSPNKEPEGVENVQ